jgi:hypothetical protein
MVGAGAVGDERIQGSEVALLLGAVSLDTSNENTAKECDGSSCDGNPRPTHRLNPTKRDEKAGKDFRVSSL